MRVAAHRGLTAPQAPGGTEEHHGDLEDDVSEAGAAQRNAAGLHAGTGEEVPRRGQEAPVCAAQQEGVTSPGDAPAITPLTAGNAATGRGCCNFGTAHPARSPGERAIATSAPWAVMAIVAWSGRETPCFARPPYLSPRAGITKDTSLFAPRPTPGSAESALVMRDPQSRGFDIVQPPLQSTSPFHVTT